MKTNFFFSFNAEALSEVHGSRVRMGPLSLLISHGPSVIGPSISYTKHEHIHTYISKLFPLRARIPSLLHNNLHLHLSEHHSWEEIIDVDWTRMIAKEACPLCCIVHPFCSSPILLLIGVDDWKTHWMEGTNRMQCITQGGERFGKLLG